ncbi:glycosyltransferase family 4 protein [Pseudomonas berkeleyensis]|uniref:Glycosyltransferase family 4 protein n=1 Tax=Pseudomonas berkeleyensis TaxID=2726956 RepID=A0A7G5DHZ5_9PSED|nr:glycosyltransferase family 4 protein [Pseudomonas berkeleyensis]QMV61370.1 glycosyltransferase family 4 protein [Pseudomonas berkeleyensis]WSO36799.1 glycosyltransferase family 4 protein [Pseudomonas berkeleyensis]
MRRKRLCFITTVPMAVSAFLRLHIERLVEDYDVFVISNYATEPLPRAAGVTYLNVPLAREISPLADLKVLFALVRLFRHHRFDAVHSVTPKAGLLGILAARMAGVPVRVHWFTGQVWVTRAGVGRAVLKSADRLIAAAASHLLADSPSQRDFLVAEGVCRAGRIEVIGDGSICGVDGERFRPDPQARERVRISHGIPADATVVLFLGRLNADKGLRELAQAMVGLDEVFPALHWLIVGPDEGGMVEHIRTVAGSLAGRLHFQGFTGEPEAYMAAAEIFCLPSYREGFGSSVLEAAAAGVPSVASRIYGLTDAVEEGVSGLLVSPANVPELVAALRRLLENDGMRLDMGLAARARALQRFSRERIVGGLSDFYGRVFAQEGKV